MSTVAFVAVAFMLAAYVMLDGYDLGVAAIAPLVAESDGERAHAMASIGPFWNGNEVWLIAAGGSLFALFPQAYASAFSGFYLPFMVVLWLLMFRGIAMELRGHLASDLWHTFWDAAFTVSSLLLIAIFGVALGNLLRGLPLDSSGYFRGTFAFLLNPYALLVGLLSVGVLALHGATWLAWVGREAPQERARRLASVLCWAVVVVYLASGAMTLAVRGASGIPGWVFGMPVLSLAALVATAVFSRSRRAAAAFAASSALVATLIATAAGTLFPYLLPAFPGGRGGVSIFDAAPSPVALGSALAVIVVGLAAVVIYASVVLRKMLPAMGARE